MLLIDKTTLSVQPGLLNECEQIVAAEYPFFASVYPGFNEWFKYHVLPGLSRGERTIVIEHRNDRVAGFLILKHAGNEKKLCTLRVREELQNRGLGIRLFEVAFELLNTDKPLLSVSDTNIGMFERIFRYFQFDFGCEYRGLYRPDSSEFSFNGQLIPSYFVRPRRGLSYLKSLIRGRKHVRLHG